MGLPVEVNNLMMGSLGGYNINRSLRFRSSASAYLSWTFGTPTNNKIYTFSCWVKRGKLGIRGDIFSHYVSDTANNYFYFNVDSLTFQYDNGTVYAVTTTAVFRDPSAWYHVVLSVDTSQATAANRTKIYVNGVEQVISGSYVPQNTNTYINNSGKNITLGRRSAAADNYFDGYLAEVNFIDGQALTPSSFGAYDTNGVWQPKKYTGTYGTNGFYLPFTNNASSTTIGYDFSGNSNNWTANNIDVTSNNYRSFTTVGTYGWTAPAGVTSVDYLIVAGGGGGGNDGGGGGGAGGVLTGTMSVTAGTNYSLTVGAGGAAATSGSNSTMFGLTAVGGGKGGSGLQAGSSGGSGGGGGRSSSGSGGLGQAGGAGTAGQGNSGGYGFLHVNGAGGGGGGAGAAGTNATNTDQFAGNGGIGIASSITGTSVYYGGGGGGGAGNVGASNGTGGNGGGGNGGGSVGGAGTANRGGGGGGGQFGGTGGAGGSGVIILSYNGAVQTSTTYDSMIDSPTVSASASNYAVLNPLDNFSSFPFTAADGNLKASSSTNNARCGRGTFGVSSGKWYWEVVIDSAIYNTYYPSPGILPTNVAIPTQLGSSGAVNVTGIAYMADGQKYSNGTLSAYGSSFTQNDIIGFALDMSAGTLVCYKNNVSQGTLVSGLSGSYSPSWNVYSSTLSFNFGQRPFSYTPPTGFNALNTYNLPAPSITNGAQNFDINLWSGNASTQTITNSASMAPDLVWIKKRAGGTTPTRDHRLFDIIRTSTKYLSSNTTSTETTETDGLTAFNSNGFTLGASDGVNGTVGGTGTYVGWQWKAGGTGVTNTSGTITSTVSANPTAGFSVVGYTGNGSSSATVGHGLGVTPNMIFVKCRSAANGWFVYHSSLSAGTYIQLNSTSGANNISATSDGAISTSPTSSTFGFTAGSVGVNNVNQNTQTFVAYCFAAVSGYSAFGSYTGNGSNDGPFIYTGFNPRWILLKQSSAAGSSWIIWDIVRQTYNVLGPALYPDLSNAESTPASSSIDFLSSGFKLRNGTGTATNGSGSTYIYAAFAENPFKYSRAR